MYFMKTMPMLLAINQENLGLLNLQLAMEYLDKLEIHNWRVKQRKE